MAQNTNPIYPLTPNIGFGVVSAANTAYDGTGTVVTIFTAGANGSYLTKIRCLAAGTSAATVAKFFINNGSTNSTAANNVFILDFSLPATTASNSQALVCYEIPLNIQLQASYKINVCLGTATGSANWAFTCFGGDY